MENDAAPSLYTVLPEKNVGVGQSSLLSTNRVYDFQAINKSQMGQASSGRSDISGGVDIALNPDEPEMSSQALEARYRQELKDKEISKEDLSDMVSDHLNRQNKVKSLFSFTYIYFRVYFPCFSFRSVKLNKQMQMLKMAVQLNKTKNSNFDLSVLSWSFSFLSSV